MYKVILSVFLMLFLTACGSSSPEVKPRPPRAATIVETGPYMTYEEYRDYSDIKAKRLGGDEYLQRQAEKAEGNHALHKRFFMLDRNHDGKLSYAELGGMD